MINIQQYLIINSAQFHAWLARKTNKIKIWHIFLYPQSTQIEKLECFS